MENLKITDEHFKYLFVQKGDLSNIADRAEWEAAYNASTKRQLAGIVPWLRRSPANVLDIGSGLGGIGILLHKQFGCKVRLLDSIDEPPVCTKHDKPFCSMEVARDFYAHNGVTEGDFSYVSPHWQPTVSQKFDLIVSFGSYCFHYAPEVYLERVKKVCNSDTVLIFHVRNRHDDWLCTLREHFTEIGEQHHTPKFTERVFTCKT